MEQNNDIRIRLKNYNKVYTLEQKIYTFGNWRLGTPLEFVPTVVSLGLAITMVAINNVIISIPIPGIVQYLILPYFIGNKVTKTRKDGKKLFKYYLDYAGYLLMKNVEREGFERIEKIKKIQFFK